MSRALSIGSSDLSTALMYRSSMSSRTGSGTVSTRARISPASPYPEMTDVSRWPQPSPYSDSSLFSWKQMVCGTFTVPSSVSTLNGSTIIRYSPLGRQENMNDPSVPTIVLKAMTFFSVSISSIRASRIGISNSSGSSSSSSAARNSVGR